MQARAALIAAILFGAAPGGAAQDDGATIRTLEEEERQAVLAADVQALDALWSDRYLVNNPQNTVSRSKAEVLGRVRNGLIRYRRFQRTIEVLRSEGELVVTMGGEVVEPIGEAPRAGQTVRRRFTHVWRREGDRWRVLVRHASVIAPP